MIGLEKWALAGTRAPGCSYDDRDERKERSCETVFIKDTPLRCFAGVALYSLARSPVEEPQVREKAANFEEGSLGIRSAAYVPSGSGSHVLSSVVGVLRFIHIFSY
jgi:hypothetical protein